MDSQMTLKSIAENSLRHSPLLFKWASKAYHAFNPSFRTLSEGTPEAIQKSFQYIQSAKLPLFGDYYEFGLFRGYTFLKAYQYSQELDVNNVNFYGFDSFQGLPAVNGVDRHDGRFYEGQFSCAKKSVIKHLKNHGMDMHKAHLIEGYYEDSLTAQLKTQYDFKPALVVLLDCDLYSSTQEVLAWMDSYLQNGTILLFDDWFSFGDDQSLGQQKALAEFLLTRPNYQVEHLWRFSKHGNAFVLKIADK